VDELEMIARRFCEALREDPDQQAMIPCPDGMPGCCVAHYGPRWRSYVGEVQRALAMNDAIAAVRASSNTGAGE